MVTLRKLTVDDLPFLLEVRNHNSTKEFLENNSEFTLEQCEIWFGNLTSPWYIIEVNKERVGYIRTNDSEVGCDIHPNYRRRGYARMAYKLYLKDKNYASLWVFEDNFAKQLYEELGFTPTGESKIVRNRNYIKMGYTSNSILILLFYYNRPEMIKNALDSIKNSNYTNFKIAFIDDGSETPGKPIVESYLPPEILSKTTFYNTNHSPEDKLNQGGSIFGYYANQAIKELNCDIAFMLCDDDALHPDYLSNLNKFFTNYPEVSYCYSQVLFYNPLKEKYTEGKFATPYTHPGSTYELNKHFLPINPSCKLDSSQVAWRTKCNFESNIWFPYPQTRSLDNSLYGDLYKHYGDCYPTKFVGQFKGVFEDQLGNRFIDGKNEFEVSFG